MSYTAIVDYGVGNLFSLSSSLKYLNIDSVVTNDENKIKDADRVILPGVGAFGDAMEKLSATGLIPVLNETVSSGKPVLGICLGMQMLFEKSFEYGEHEGLGWIKGRVIPMEPEIKKLGLTLKIPHMGWNSLDITNPESRILKNTAQGDFVYFVHSFCASDCDGSISASADYGIRVPACVEHENVFGCQFHPEKSGKTGLAILSAFAEI